MARTRYTTGAEARARQMHFSLMHFKLRGQSCWALELIEAFMFIPSWSVFCREELVIRKEGGNLIKETREDRCPGLYLVFEQ